MICIMKLQQHKFEIANHKTAYVLQYCTNQPINPSTHQSILLHNIITTNT